MRKLFLSAALLVAATVPATAFAGIDLSIGVGGYYPAPAYYEYYEPVEYRYRPAPPPRRVYYYEPDPFPAYYESRVYREPWCERHHRHHRHHHH